MYFKKSFVMCFAVTIAITGILTGCISQPPAVNVVTLEEKGTPRGIPAPEWVKLYESGRITAIQAMPEYKDKYCIVGEERGANKQFVLAWADNFSAQQQIGAQLRTSIASAFEATVSARAESTGGANTPAAAGISTGNYQQTISNSINSVVNVNYTGAQREGDWWMLLRHYDPDVKNVYSDEYVAYVLYIIPKVILNTQISDALSVNASLDPELAEITKAVAKRILLGEVELIKTE